MENKKNESGTPISDVTGVEFDNAFPIDEYQDSGIVEVDKLESFKQYMINNQEELMSNVQTRLNIDIDGSKSSLIDNTKAERLNHSFNDIIEAVVESLEDAIFTFQE